MPTTSPQTVATSSGGSPRPFGEDEIIVSKTDAKGHIRYVNRTFVEVSGFAREELLGQPHRVIRHDSMPGGVFRILWETIASGREIFAYIKNATANGGHYWVLAHVTPSYDSSGRISGYHSNRRCPSSNAVRRIEPVYREMQDIERGISRRAQAAEASAAYLLERVSRADMTYEQYVWRLIREEKSGLGDD